MNKLIISIIVILMSITQVASAEVELSDSLVRKLLDDIQIAVSDKNVDKLSSFLTDDVIVTLEMPKNMGGAMEMNKEQYEAMLRAGWSMPAKFTYEVKDIVITVAQNKKSAVVTDVTTESIELNGKILMATVTKETIDIVVSAGTAKIKRIHGKVEVLNP